MLGRGRHKATRSKLGRRYDLLWFGQAVSQLGDYVAYLTVPLFVLSLKRGESSLDFAITYSLENIPTFLFGLLGGVMLDRMRLRPLMIVADVARAAAFFWLAWVAANPGPDPQSSLYAVFTVAFLIGSFSALFGNALYAMLPSVVEARHLAVANARIAASQQATLALGPLLAGVLVSQVSHWPAFVLNGLTFLVSAVSIAMIGPVPKPERGPRIGILSEAINGLLYLWNEIRLRISTAAAAIANFVMGFLEATFVVLADDVLGATSDWQKGVLLAALGIGGVAGAAFAPSLVRFIGLGKTMVTGLAVFGLAFLSALQYPFGFAGLTMFFVAFFGLSMVNVPLATIRQTYTPPVMLGRVITAARAIGWATLPIGSLLGAAIADSSGNYAVVATVSPILLVVTAVALVFTPVWTDAFGPTRGRRRAGAPERSTATP